VCLPHMLHRPYLKGIGFKRRWRLSTSIPRHASKDIGRRLLAKILRELGIDRKDFDGA